MIDETDADAAMFGMEPLGLPKDDNDFAVLPEAWPAVEMFLRVQTQWRVSSGGLVGLDYGAVKWCFELWDVTNGRELLDDLRVIEGKVIEIMSKRNG